MRKKSLIWFISLFALLFSFGIGHRYLICFGVKSYLSTHLPKGGSLEVSYDQARYMDGSLILHNFSVIRGEKKGSPSFNARVDDLKMTFSFQMFPFRFSPKITMDHPHITLGAGDYGQGKKKKGMYDTFDKLFFQTPVKVREGEVFFGDQVARISFESPLKEKEGILKVSKGEEDSPFTMTFTKTRKQLHFDCDFDHLDASWAFEIGRFFLPTIEDDMEVKGGELHGIAELTLAAQKKLECVKYSLELNDFSFAHKKYGIEMKLTHLGWKQHFTSNDEMGELKSHPFFEKLWPYFIGDGEVSGLHMVFDHPQTEEAWAASDVNGTLRFSRLNRPLMEFHGLFNPGEKKIPFHLIGEGKIEEEEFWKVTFDAHFFEEEENHAFFALTSKGNGTFALEGEGKEITSDQLNLFKQFTEVYIPSAQKISVEEGKFNGRVEGWIENKQLTGLQVIYFDGSDVMGNLLGEEIKWKMKKVRGKGEFDLSSVDFFDGTLWEVEIAGGEVDIHGEKIDEIDLSMAMYDQYLKPSLLTCQYEGLEGKFAFEGLYTHLNINMALLAFPKSLARFLGEEVLEPLAFELDLKLKTNKGYLGAKGSLGLVHKEGENDTIEFGCNLDLSDFSCLEDGWFRAEKISSELLNLPLMFWNQDFRGRGTLGIEGTFNSREIEFNIDPRGLKYESEAIDILPQKEGGEKVPKCNFFYDIEKRTWRGTIPLKDAQVQEHSFGLHFDSFTSEVKLEGTELLFQNVDAMADGIHFQAEIVVDSSLKDRNELTIDTYSIDGEMADALIFLEHFQMFQETELPLRGILSSGAKGMHLHAYVGDIEELLEWRISLHFSQGSYPFLETFGFENLSGDFYYSAEDQRIKIQEVAGDLTLTAGEFPKSYSLNVPLFELDAKEGILKFDCRLEAPTYEICRIVGSAAQNEEEFLFRLDRDQSRFFGAQMDVKTLAFKEGFLSRADLSTTLSALDLVHHLDFLNSAGLLPLKEETLSEMRGPHVEGEMRFAFTFDRLKETLSFEGESSHLRMGAIDLDHLLVHGAREKDHFNLDRFEAGPLKIHAEMVKKEKQWHIPDLEILWKKSFLKSGLAIFNEEEKSFRVPLDGLRLDLEEFRTLFPQEDFDWSYLTGTLFAKGNLIFDVSKGIREWALDSELHFAGEDFGKGKLRLESPQTLHLTYNFHSGFSLNQADVNFFHPRSNQLWAKCHFDQLSCKGEAFQGVGVRVIVPPEMVHFLGQTHSLPHLSYEEERMIVFGRSIEWENQIEAFFDFKLGKTSYVKGELKAGYYWMGNKAWYLNNCSFSYQNHILATQVSTLYDNAPFDINASFSFAPHFHSHLSIQEMNNGGSDPLVIQTDWNENEGYFIQNIDGSLCGLDFSFHHNPKESFLDKVALTGQLKVNVPRLSKFMPEEIQNTVKEFEVGRGYELSGDLILSKINLEESHFSGYLKGKNFELMGTLMGTLMSEIDIRYGHIELDHFTISDTSGMFAIDSVRLMRQNEEDWNLIIPEVMITDFRPSLLKKIGKYPTRIKPLTVRELHASNIQGTIGKPASFVGKGSLSFINTFKRDYHLNILDIPFEILGRLGLDMGLLVPVRGALDYVIVDGKVYFTELKDSYSEGKRSQFFLSPNSYSYVDFDGNINVNIKMKQYVLLKVTEPFTLSIGGTFDNPKYGLH